MSGAGAGVAGERLVVGGVACVGRPPHHDGASQGVVVRAWRIPEREKDPVSFTTDYITGGSQRNL